MDSELRWQKMSAPIDVPPFDRSNVDGFAVRSADLAAAGEGSPVACLNDEIIALRHRANAASRGGNSDVDRHRWPAAARRRCRRDGRAHPADRLDAIDVRRAASPGQFVSYAGSDIARGEALLRAGTIIGSREIGMLAACGIAGVTVARNRALR